MKLLLVEDDPDYLPTLREAIEDAIEDVEISIAMSRESAVEELEANGFDLILCDLRIPTQDSALDDEVDHGVSAVTTARSLYPGTPVFVHSAHADRHLIPELLDQAPQEDFTGSREEDSLIQFVHKDKLKDCVEKVYSFHSDLALLENVVVSTGAQEVDLDRFEDRLLRIFARRHEAEIVQVRELNGGLSSSKVLRLRLLGRGGNTRALAVAKVGRMDDVLSEKRRYDNYVSPLLPPGAFAPLTDQIKAGAGPLAAVFYSLSDDSQSLFDLLEGDPQEATALLKPLRRRLSPWHEGAPMDPMSIGDIRREVIDDDLMEELADENIDQDWRAFEKSEILVRRCIQHGDLHGENVLTPEDQPLVIDFGEVREAVASLDPLSLELSLLFHPDGRRLCDDWPSVEQARMWHSLTRYLDGCPLPEFVRECREWVFEVAENEQAVYANLYVQAVRQLKYPNTNHELAAALINVAVNRL